MSQKSFNLGKELVKQSLASVAPQPNSLPLPKTINNPMKNTKVSTTNADGINSLIR